MPTYAKAPITEAIINLKPEKSIAERSISRASSKIGKFYFRSEDLNDAQITFHPKTGQHATAIHKAGQKWSSSDASDIAVVQPQGLTVSRLAPYCGWPAFVERFERDWKIWSEEVNTSVSTRIGVRYINRIDVPCGLGNNIRIEDYFAININTPDPNQEFLEHDFGFVARANNPDFLTRIRVGSVPSPIIEHISFIFDIDVWTTRQQLKKDGVIDILSEMRDIKNNNFEEYLTSRAKGLFE